MIFNISVFISINVLKSELVSILFME